jgi:hypothetical protein
MKMWPIIVWGLAVSATSHESGKELPRVWEESHFFKLTDNGLWSCITVIGPES